MKARYDFLANETDAYTAPVELDVNVREPAPVIREPTIKSGAQYLVLNGKAPLNYGWTGGIALHNVYISMAESRIYCRIVEQSQSRVLFYINPSGRFPKETVQISTTQNATSESEAFDQLWQNTKLYLQTLANDYASGIIDIPEIVNQLGEPWTDSTVVLLLELLGAHRPIVKLGLPQEDRKRVLAKLAHIRAEGKAEDFNTSDWIERETIASQRIESVYIWPKRTASNQT